jgi:hypothetical protein
MSKFSLVGPYGVKSTEQKPYASKTSADSTNMNGIGYGIEVNKPPPVPPLHNFKDQYNLSSHNLSARRGYNPHESAHIDQSNLTGLVIGGMTVVTAEERDKKIRAQKQYAQEVARAAAAEPIKESRESLQERNAYKGNGLPGGYQIRGNSSGGGASSISFGHGGGNANVSPRQTRINRVGQQQEYAEQLRQQVNKH